MSTRSFIGKWVDIPSGKIQAIYIHHDGYPSAKLYEIANGISQVGEPSAFLELLLSAGSGSSLPEDLSLPPAWDEYSSNHLVIHTRQKYYNKFLTWMDEVKSGKREMSAKFLKNINRYQFEKTNDIQVVVFPDGLSDIELKTAEDNRERLVALQESRRVSQSYVEVLKQLIEDTRLTDGEIEKLSTLLSQVNTVADQFDEEYQKISSETNSTNSDQNKFEIVIPDMQPDNIYYRYWRANAFRSYYARGEDRDMNFDNLLDAADSWCEYGYLFDDEDNLWVFASYSSTGFMPVIDGEPVWGKMKCIGIIPTETLVNWLEDENFDFNELDNREEVGEISSDFIMNKLTEKK